jgi:hypothetical protein
LKEFEISEKLMPTNVHNKFNKAITLIILGRDNEGFEILKQLERACPKEP